MRDSTMLVLPAYTLGYPGSNYLFAATVTSLSSLKSSTTVVEVNELGSVYWPTASYSGS